MPTKTIWSFFIDHYRLTYLLTAGIIIFGIFSIGQIPKESAPEVDFPIVVVSTFLPGAAAEDVEELVTDRIERALQGLSEVDGITSVSSQGFSQVTVQFDVDSDSREKLDDVRTRVDDVSSDLPEDATDPSVQQISFSDVPIITFSLSGPYALGDLKSFAEAIQDDLERIGDVSRVNIVGAPEEEIQVTLYPERLEQFGLSAAQVAQSISQSNVDMPIGSIETAGDIYTLRFAGRIENADDVLGISVSAKSGTTVLLSDIADVKTTFPEGETVTRFGSRESEPEPAVLIDVYKQSGEGNILKIADTAEEHIRLLAEDGTLPPDVRATTIRSDAELIRVDLRNLLSSGAQTIVIVILVLVIFLGWREALLMSIQAPLTFLITFIVITYLGYTINFLTLFSLILSLGILVDAGIVVVESMFEKMSKGSTARGAAFDTLHEFQMPLISGTLTTIFVFLPMLLMTGIIGKYVESIPVTVTVVLTAAIIVSLGFITAFATRFLKVKKGESEGGLPKIKEGIVKLYTWYGKTLAGYLDDRKKSKRLLWIMVILFVIAMALPITGIVKVQMFPSEDLDYIAINIENPVGTPLAVTNVMTEEVETFLANDPRVENFVSRIGSGAAGGMLGGFGTNSHKATVTVRLIKDREETSLEIVPDLERKLHGLVDAEITVGQEAGGPPQGSPVQMRVLGTSLEDLDAAAITLAHALEGIEGTRNVETGIQDSNGELVFSVNRSKARLYGASELQIAQELRSALSGIEAASIQKDGEDIKVMVSTRIGNGSESGGVVKGTIEQINAVTVATTLGPIPVSAFGDLRLASSRQSISHEDGERVLSVTADVVDGANSQVIVSQIKDALPSLGLPNTVNVEFGGEAEDIAESFASLGQAMIIGILGIFGLLIWQFRSYRQPIFIITTIPLALIGVFAGLGLTGNPVSFPGFIGIVALAGIVVNNAIILIDSINADRRGGMTTRDAIESSARSRLQPIILTTLTTVAGMVPLAFSSPVWAPLAISIMAGLLFSTILTLFVVPILYLLFGEKELESIE